MTKLPTYVNRFCAVVDTLVTVPIVIALWRAEGGHPPPVVLIPFVLMLFSAPLASVGIIGAVFELRRGHRNWMSYLAFAVNVIFVAATIVMLVWLTS